MKTDRSDCQVTAVLDRWEYGPVKRHFTIVRDGKIWDKQVLKMMEDHFFELSSDDKDLLLNVAEEYLVSMGPGLRRASRWIGAMNTIQGGSFLKGDYVTVRRIGIIALAMLLRANEHDPKRRYR